MLATIVAATVVAVRQAIEATRSATVRCRSRSGTMPSSVSSPIMLTEVAPTDQPVLVADLLERSQEVLLSEEDIPEHRAAILSVLGGYYLSSGKPGQADELLKRSRELTKATTDLDLRSKILCESGYAASLLGRLDDAKAMIDEGLTLGRDSPSAAVRCLRNRGFISQNTNDPKGALEYATAAQARLKDYPVPNPDMEAQILADIAAAHYLAGRNGDAERNYAQAMDILAKRGRADSPGAFFLRNNWGLASNSSGDPRRALEQYDEAIRIACHPLDRRRAAAVSAPQPCLRARPRSPATTRRCPRTGRARRGRRVWERRGAHRQPRVPGEHLPADGRRRRRRAGTRRHRAGDREGRACGQRAGDGVPAWPKRAPTRRAGRLPAAIAGFTQIVDFFDGRQMTVAPLARVLIARGEAELATGDLQAAKADAERALERFAEPAGRQAPLEPHRAVAPPGFAH